MYQVICLYGSTEPWWCIGDWEEDITSRSFFNRYEDARNAYQKEWARLSEQFPMRKMKDSTMVAFWDEKDQYWCDECDDYLQRYHSLILVESKEVPSQGERNKESTVRARSCQLRN